MIWFAFRYLVNATFAVCILLAFCQDSSFGGEQDSPDPSRPAAQKQTSPPPNCVQVAVFQKLDHPCLNFKISAGGDKTFVIPNQEFSFTSLSKLNHVDVVGESEKNHISLRASEEYSIYTLAAASSKPLLVLGAVDIPVNPRLHCRAAIEIHDYQQRRLLRTIPIPQGLMPRVAVSARGDLVAYSLGNVVVVEDIMDAKERLRLACKEAVKSIAFSSDGSRLAASHGFGTVNIVEIASGKIVSKLSGEGSSIHDITFLSEGRRLGGVCGDDDSVRVWNVISGECIASLNDMQASGLAAIGSEGDAVSVLDRQGSVRIFSATLRREIATVDLQEPATAISESPMEGCFAVCDRAGYIRVLQLPAPSAAKGYRSTMPNLRLLNPTTRAVRQ